MRRWTAYALLTLAALMVALGGLAGLLNREVLDEGGFVANVDELRKDPEVSTAIGEQVADAAVAQQPNLVAVKPLIGQVSAGLISSDAASPIFRLAASQAHRTLTTPDSQQIVLRLADFGSVVTSLLRTVSPDAAAAIPPNLPVTLSTVGGQGGPIASAVRYAQIADTLSWLLPLLALALLALGVAVHPNTRRGFVGAGLAIVAGGGLLLLLAVGAQIWASTVDDSTLIGAVEGGLWTSFGQPLFSVATLILIVGGMVAVLASASLPDVDVDERIAAVGGWVTRRPSSIRAAVARGLVIALLGLGLIFWTQPVIQGLAVVLGVGVLLYGVLEVDRAIGKIEARDAARRVESGLPERRRRGWLVPAALGTTGVLVAGGLLALNVRPPDSPIQAIADRTEVGCNGHLELCDRPYDEVSYVAAHNAMSAEDADFFLAEQPTGMVGLLDQGVRVLLIDTWYGQPLDNGKALTSPQSFPKALEQAKVTFGPEIMQSVNRLVQQLQGGSPSGPVQPYLCHTVCEIGGTPLLNELQGVRAWMDAHPTEVVSIFIQDAVSPEDTAAVFDQAGLTRLTHAPRGAGDSWPTLGEMVDSGKRLVVLQEEQGGGTAYPWLLQGFDYVQDTGYTYPTVESFDCQLNRGRAASPLFMVNHWLSNFTTLYTDAQKVNAADVLGPRVEQCQAERGRLPNFVAVNWNNLGDVPQVVDQLNGL